MITLIMLSVITFMAVTFLVLSTRQGGQVSTTTDQATASFAAQTASQRAMSELLARVLAITNSQNIDLMVSTNFINQAGYDPLAADYRTNVNYDHTINNLAMGAYYLRNLTNLLLNPRPPVFVVTNPAFPRRADFRYYLDLNRNGRYETNGYLPVISPDPALPLYNATNGTLMQTFQSGIPVASNDFVGDPEWIGILEHPGQPHSADNKFLARGAYIVVPASKTLDVNYIHNASAVRSTLGNVMSAYRRNMGVGSWEINLAAFLADLNTNQWCPALFPASTAYYEYLPLNGLSGFAQGSTFAQAAAFLNYRYNNSVPTLPLNLNLQTPRQSFSPEGLATFQTDDIDEFGSGFFMTGTTLPGNDADLGRANLGWPGADNPYHFFSTQDFFDPAKVSGQPMPPFGFTNALVWAGTNIDSYDRYTFYRMLAQLGTDSTPEQNKINVNFLNVDPAGNIVPGMETNMISWNNPRILLGFPNNNPPLPPYPAPGPLVFFTNAVARMFQDLGLHDAYGNLITFNYIPIYPVNYYTPAVHRVLQLAANIFEATVVTNVPVYPSIYRPYFQLQDFTNYVICGFELVNGPRDRTTSTAFYAPPGAGTNDPQYPIDLNDPSAQYGRGRIGSTPTHLNIFGIPWVIGARKGFPNLNAVSIQSVAQITRKLRVSRPSVSADISQYRVSQLFEIGISNSLGVEVWNSYRTNFPDPVLVQADADAVTVLTNGIVGGGVAIPTISSNLFLGGYNLAPGMGAITLAANQWQGTRWIAGEGSKPVNALSFQAPIVTNVIFLPESGYRRNPPALVPVPPNAVQDWLINPPDDFPLPLWGLSITNRLRCMILDGGVGGRIIDYVQFEGPNNYRDLSGEIYSPDPSLTVSNMWSTNSVLPLLGRFVMPQGLNNQLYVAAGNWPVSDSDWANTMIGAPQGRARDLAIAGFYAFIYGGPNGGIATWTDPLTGQSFTATNRALVAQVPFTPTSKRYLLTSWEANDPLVHYTSSDLIDLARTNNLAVAIPPNQPVTPVQSNFFTFTRRYDPWGGNPKLGSAGDPNAFNLAVKDPMVRASDDWDFPTNALPNIGWLGRVHRGTPWQTVYLKAADVATNLNNWGRWTGDSARWFVGGTNTADSFYGRPAADRLLFDTFTTAINDNAARGALSVNQTNLAAWSAVLSGVIVLTNSASGTNYVPMVISPAGPYNQFLPLSRQPPLVQIWRSINDARTNYPDQLFTHAGDVLSAPLLTEQSPYLRTNALFHQDAGGLSDEVMERIPQQIMSLLTLNPSPRFVIYAYGQALKPADHSIYTGGGALAGLCTNYQITAESAVRAVVHVEGSPNPDDINGKVDSFGRSYPPHIVVDQFNVMPAD